VSQIRQSPGLLNNIALWHTGGVSLSPVAAQFWQAAMKEGGLLEPSSGSSGTAAAAASAAVRAQCAAAEEVLASSASGRYSAAFSAVFACGRFHAAVVAEAAGLSRAELCRSAVDRLGRAACP
jgi:hypothetical protein